MRRAFYLTVVAVWMSALYGCHSSQEQYEPFAVTDEIAAANAGLPYAETCPEFVEAARLSFMDAVSAAVEQAGGSLSEEVITDGFRQLMCMRPAMSDEEEGIERRYIVTVLAVIAPATAGTSWEEAVRWAETQLEKPEWEGAACAKMIREAGLMRTSEGKPVVLVAPYRFVTL